MSENGVIVCGDSSDNSAGKKSSRGGGVSNRGRGRGRKRGRGAGGAGVERGAGRGVGKSGRGRGRKVKIAPYVGKCRYDPAVKEKSLDLEHHLQLREYIQVIQIHN